MGNILILSRADELITPENAQELLDHNYEYNRHLRQSTVQAYVADIEHNDFDPLLGQSIVIHEDGTLLDGQHRMKAVVESGISCFFNVQRVRGDKAEIYSKIDCGLRRSAADSLGISNKQAALSKAMVAITYGTTPPLSAIQGNVAPRRNATTAEIGAFFANNREEVTYVAQEASKLPYAGVRGSLMGFSVWLYIHRALGDGDKAEAFLEGVANPVNATYRQSIATFQAITRFNNNKKRGTANTIEAIGLMESGFKAAIKGREAPKCFNQVENQAVKLISQYQSIYNENFIGGQQ